MEPYAVAFARWLADAGFSQSRIEKRLCQLGHLSRWLEVEGLRPDELAVEHQQRFIEARRTAGSRTWLSRQSLRVPLAYLREAGIAAVPASVAPDGPVERLLADYRQYLADERGLVAHTIYHHELVARLFLCVHEQPDGIALERLSTQDVSVFLARECPKRSVSGARDLVKGLRGLLRYLHVTGVIAMPLQWSVPAVAYRRDRILPRGLPPEAVARLLASCDRRRAVGRRDYAVLILLSRLGLRAGEVAAMQLEDVDWRRGEFQVRGKGARLDRLPLPVDVGRAIVSYLRYRPHSASRAVFLLVRAPYCPLSGQTVSGIVHRACVRAELPVVHAHRLRHTAATEMLRAGGSLPEVAQVLRHRQLATTKIYAKVDHRSLRALARPWPGGAS
ncbi:MAG: site-specific integrase [Actinomycetota bacterium]|nr:site-specific integrase [Actinomycetota bacterium]